MESVIRNKSSKMILRVKPKIPALLINDKYHEFADIKEAELFHLVIESAPNILSYDKIKESILLKYKVSDTPYSDSQLYIRKKKLSLSKFLKDSTGYDDIVQNVRGSGYRLNNQWEPCEIKNSDDNCVFSYQEWMFEIEGICNAAIELQYRMPFLVRECEDGKILSLDKSKFIDEIEVISMHYQLAVKNFMDKILAHGVNILHVTIFNKFQLIFSYVNMDRQGANISEEMWHLFFEKELQNHISSLNQDISMLKL